MPVFYFKAFICGCCCASLPIIYVVFFNVLQTARGSKHQINKVMWTQHPNVEQLRLLCCPKTFLTAAVQNDAVTSRALNVLLPPPPPLLLLLEALETASRPADTPPRSTVMWSLEQPLTVPATVRRTVKGAQHCEDHRVNTHTLLSMCMCVLD